MHTDVPEFRGLNRKLVPQWLLVVMHHSGLFDAWRLPIATGIAWFGASEGGALVYWPDGPDGPARADRGPPQHRRGARHGQRVPRRRAGRSAGRGAADPRARARCSATAADGRVVLRDASGGEVREYRVGGAAVLGLVEGVLLRRRSGERDTWREHPDDLDLATVLDALVADLGRARSRRRRHLQPDAGRSVIDEYVGFPSTAARAGLVIKMT